MVDPFHTRPVAQILGALDVDADRGLDAAEVGRRREQFGENELEAREGRSIWELLWEQVKGVMTLILIGAAIFALAIGKHVDGGAILAIVVLFVALGVFTVICGFLAFRYLPRSM